MERAREKTMVDRSRWIEICSASVIVCTMKQYVFRLYDIHIRKILLVWTNIIWINALLSREALRMHKVKIQILNYHVKATNRSKTSSSTEITIADVGSRMHRNAIFEFEENQIDPDPNPRGFTTKSQTSQSMNRSIETATSRPFETTIIITAVTIQTGYIPDCPYKADDGASSQITHTCIENYDLMHFFFYVQNQKRSLKHDIVPVRRSEEIIRVTLRYILRHLMSFGPCPGLWSTVPTCPWCSSEYGIAWDDVYDCVLWHVAERGLFAFTELTFLINSFRQFVENLNWLSVKGLCLMLADSFDTIIHWQWTCIIHHALYSRHWKIQTVLYGKIALHSIRDSLNKKN